VWQVFLLCINAELENVGALKCNATSFALKLRESGGAEVKDNVHVSAAEEHEVPGGKGTANLVMKFAKVRHIQLVAVQELLKGWPAAALIWSWPWLAGEQKLLQHQHYGFERHDKALHRWAGFPLELCVCGEYE
jgi:hypothetical protein